MPCNMLVEARKVQSRTRSLQPELLFVNGRIYEGDFELDRLRGKGWEGGRTRSVLLHSHIDPSSEVFLVDIGFLRHRRCTFKGVRYELQEWDTVEIPGDP